jgi:hypothetical protein
VRHFQNICYPSLCHDFALHSGDETTVSAVKKVEFVSDRMSYIILRGHRCDIIVMNVHAPTDDITDDNIANKQYQDSLKKFYPYTL